MTIEAERLDYTVRTIDAGCEFRARIRAVGKNGAGGYARLEPTRVSEEICDMLRPAVPTPVRAEAVGDFNEATWVQNVRVSWTQPDGPGNVAAWWIERLRTDVPSATPSYIHAVQNPNVIELGATPPKLPS